jgi:hypothetical protein
MTLCLVLDRAYYYSYEWTPSNVLRCQSIPLTRPAEIERGEAGDRSTTYYQNLGAFLIQ